MFPLFSLEKNKKMFPMLNIAKYFDATVLVYLFIYLNEENKL